MAKTTGVNPKLALMRKVFGKARPVLVRGLGELARVQVTPKRAEELAAKLMLDLGNLLAQEFGATKEQLLPPDAPLPDTGSAWVLFGLNQQTNASHALEWCGPAVLYVKDGRPLAGGCLLGNMEEPLLVTAGEGASTAEGRCRVSGRMDLKGAMVMLPLNSSDCAKLELLELAGNTPFHSRKSGHPLYDLWLVATGRADAMAATRLRPMEAALIELVMRESGGSFAYDAGRDLALAGGKALGELKEALGVNS